jgi:hypothetical protein
MESTDYERGCDYLLRDFFKYWGDKQAEYEHNILREPETYGNSMLSGEWSRIGTAMDNNSVNL